MIAVYADVDISDQLPPIGLQRFTDAFSKTIPMWSCVVNRAVAAVRRTHPATQEIHFTAQEPQLQSMSGAGNERGTLEHDAAPPPSVICTPGKATCAESGWDVGLHLPLWVSANEAQQIEARLDGWVEQLLSCAGSDRIWSLAQVGVRWWRERAWRGGGDIKGPAVRQRLSSLCSVLGVSV